jgi:hypothetical protein
LGTEFVCCIYRFSHSEILFPDQRYWSRALLGSRNSWLFKEPKNSLPRSQGLVLRHMGLVRTSHCIPLRSILDHSHVCLGIPSALFPSGSSDPNSAWLCYRNTCIVTNDHVIKISQSDRIRKKVYLHIAVFKMHRISSKNCQNYRVFGLCPCSGILETRKHNVSETGYVSVLRWGGKTPT